MQRLRLGLSLDGERGWHPRDALGSMTVGPLGLLTTLEIQLGLVRQTRSQAERIVQMRECLQDAQTGGRFYEKSFSTDEFGTAATLLAWRDLWLEHGWNGAVSDVESGRLHDMAALETLARDRVSPGMGERLKAVAEALATRRPQIEIIEILDPLEHFSTAWRAVLARLPVAIESSVPTVPIAPAGTFLNALQGGVLRLLNGAALESMPWRDDGSVQIVRSETRLAAAEWLAAQMGDRPSIDRVWIVEQSGTLADAARSARDQPLLGLSNPSAFRPSLQLLPLILRLIWDPLDFKALMQFLTHPVGPLGSYARRRLAEKIASRPGIGGEAWQTVLGEIQEHEGEQGASLLADIRFWLDHPRFSPAEAAPIEFLLERVDRLTVYFQKGSGIEDPVRRSVWMAGYQQARAVSRALTELRQQGVRRISPESLDKLISHATASGSDHPLLRAQAFAHCSVSKPDALIEAFDDVVWWNLAAVPLVGPYPWSPQELFQLRALGVELPDTAALLERQARSWWRPLLNARQRLTLMLPSEAEEAHPVWLSFKAMIEGAAIKQVEDALSGDGGSVGAAAIAFRALPARRRWWKVPAGAIHRWERSASYSSLDQFFFNPSLWVLNYPAQLKASALLDLPGDFQLLGNLAHRVVERLYRRSDALFWSIEKVLDWFDREVDQIILEEGAVLLMAGRGTDREAFRQRCRRSIQYLHQLLQATGVLGVEPEKTLIADTPLGTLKGSSDLLVTLADTRQAIIDMKWAGNAKYREKIKGQTHIQLAIYARMVENNTNRWPAVAYLILSRPELLTSAEGAFNGVNPIIVAGSSTAAVWERISATWGWRRKQVEAGMLEVVMDDIEPTDDTEAPPNILPIEAPDVRYNQFMNLMGWESEQ